MLSIIERGSFMWKRHSVKEFWLQFFSRKRKFFFFHCSGRFDSELFGGWLCIVFLLEICGSFSRLISWLTCLTHKYHLGGGGGNREKLVFEWLLIHTLAELRVHLRVLVIYSCKICPGSRDTDPEHTFLTCFFLFVGSGAFMQKYQVRTLVYRYVKLGLEGIGKKIDWIEPAHPVMHMALL